MVLISSSVGRDMRTLSCHPGQAGDLLLVGLHCATPLCHWLRLPHGPWSLAGAVEFCGERDKLCPSCLPLTQGAQKSWLCLQVEESSSEALLSPHGKAHRTHTVASQSMVVTHINGVFLSFSHLPGG